MDANEQICRKLGLQPVHLAALFGDTEQISRIAASTPDFDINASVRAIPNPPSKISSSRGETPIMLATMMGHIKTVEIIVFHGARTDQEDDYGCTAARFYTSENATKTHREFYLTRGLGEEAPDSINIRHAIRDYLESDISRRFTLRPGDAGYTQIHLAKHPRKLVASAPFAEVNIGLSVGRQKEIGCLKIFNDYDIHLWAKSGYRPKGEGADNKCLDGKQLCDTARKKIAPILRFTFPKSKYDYSKKRQYTANFDGRSRASHVEVQLSTAYVLQLVNKYYPGTDKTLTEKLKLLRSTQLGNERDTVIYITSMPCRPCDVYLNKLSTYTQVNFKVVGNCGNAQVRRERGKHQQLEDSHYEHWQDSDGEADDEYVCVKCGGHTLNGQTSSTQALVSQPSPVSITQLTQSTNADSPILIGDSDEEYDSDHTLPDTLQQDTKPNSPPTQKALPITDIMYLESSPSEVTPSPASNDCSSPVVQRELSNPFQGNFYIPVRTTMNFPLVTSEFLSTFRRSTSARDSALVDNTPCPGTQRQQQGPVSPSQVIPKYAELALKGPPCRHARPNRGREGTDLSYEEPVRRKARANHSQVADVYSVPSSTEVSQIRSRAVSRSRFSRAPSVRPPALASLKQQARVRKAQKRKKRASARTRGAADGNIAPPTKSFRSAGLDLNDFRCQG